MPRTHSLISPILMTLAACQLAAAADRTTRNLVARGNIQYRRLDFTGALAKYDEAIKKDAKYAIAHNNRGLALHKLGKLPDAVAAFKKAIELDGKKAAFHLNLGKAYATAARPEPALEEFDEALKLDPKMAAAVYNRMWVLDQKGEIDEAALVATDLKKMEKHPPGVSLLVGIAAARGGQLQELAHASFASDDLPQLWRWLGEFNRCMATGGIHDMPQEARAALRQAMAAFSTEQFSEARKHLADAAEAAAQSPVPHWLTAMAWQLEGKSKEARVTMAKAESLMPSVHLPAEGAPMALSVDGTFVGCSPARIRVLPGVHLLQLARSSDGGFDVLTKCLRCNPEEGITIPEGDFLPVTTPPGMVPVPAATFMMGSRDGEPDEEPVHSVSVPAFWIDRTEVTNGQYAGFLGALKERENNDDPWRHPDQAKKKDHTPAYWKDKKLDDPHLPVVGVDWFDAYAYAQWAGKRLPTEAEWELAAGGTGERTYPWGTERPDAGGTFRANYDPGFHSMDGYAMLASADAFAEGATPAGCLNMAGNAWEWVSDWHDKDFYKHSPPLSPHGPRSGTARVARGGSWNSPAGNLRVAARKPRSPTTRAKDVGFRCVVDVVPPIAAFEKGSPPP